MVTNLVMYNIISPVSGGASYIPTLPSSPGATAQRSAWSQAAQLFADATASDAVDTVTCGTLLAVLGRWSWRRAFQALMHVTQVGG